MNILSSQQINDLLRSDLQDPFSVLGMHEEQTGLSVRAFLPGAQSISVRNRETGKSAGEMKKVHDDGIFELHMPRRKKIFPYELIVTRHDGTVEPQIDPYSFLPIMSEEARYLFNEGNHQEVYQDLGSHKKEVDGIQGVVFAVWAPNAKRVSVVGDFNNWDGRRHPMRLLGASGIWELFIPGVSMGTVYKYEIKKRENDHLMLKTDPFGYYQEPFPHHGSIVWDLDAFEWDDDQWMEVRRQQDVFKRPMSIYEVHLGSWVKSGPSEDGDYLSYEDLAKKLADYVSEMGYTHIELMPIQEHPYVPSWGYQVSGFYAPNHRFGNPSGFQYLVNYMHKRGIGVILDWVPGHFPKDNFCLSHFDGTHLYEHQDPREGEHRDWGTLIFNFGRHEVHNFLTANALFWLDHFHVDGLRVDAVASMLYRNYSREEGDWLPNKFGGVENLEAIEFLQSMNHLVHHRFPGAVTIAEESTAWPMVSRPTHLGGLGFTFKWNMGWMNDILTYFSKDPIYRKYHHDQLTFGLWYAFNENFVLVLSHDEVVHGKRSLLEKMPGDTWQKFANLRSLYGFMYGHPGKKLVFMGGEFGMHSEWYELQSIDWHLLEHCDDAYHHNGTMRLMADLNRLYKNESALWEFDFEPRGFSWIDHSDSDNSIVSFIRHGSDWHNFLIVVCNFTPSVHREYRVGVPHGGYYRELINTDAPEYGGAGFGNLGGKQAEPIPWHGHSYSLNLTLPPLSVLILKWER
ncbi:MAG: 1,4-alpha-glucan branching protein GlgB [Chitinivibrionales bacterium]